MVAKPRMWFGWFLVFSWIASQGPVFGQEEPNQPAEFGISTTQQTPHAVIALKRSDLAQELAAVQRKLESASEQEGSPPQEHLAKEVELLERINLTLGQQEAQLRRAQELRASEEQLEADLATFRSVGPTEDRPDSFLLLETVRSELNAHADRSERLADTGRVIRKSLGDAGKEFEERERLRRQVKETLESNTDDSVAADLATSFRLAELESRLASETVGLRKLELRNHTLADDIQQLRQTFLSEKAAWIEQRAQFTQADLDEQLDKVAREEFALKRRLEAANFDLDSAVRRLGDARQRHDQTAGPDQGLVEEVEAARLAREARQRTVTLLGERLHRLVLMRTLWTRRFQVVNRSAEADELTTWQKEVSKELDQLDLMDRLQSDEVAQLRKSLVTLQEKLDSTKENDPQAARWIREQARYLEQQITSYEACIASIEITRRLSEKLLAGIEAEVGTTSLGEQLSAVWEIILAAWRYELTSVDDNPITVSKIVIGLFLLVAGFLVSRIVSRILVRRVLVRVGFQEGAAAAVQSLLFYLLVLTFTLIALRIVNVPLTAFTIAGGAIAIGVGFGSQNIINNFMSGLSLLVERPIRVGDFIEIDGVLGTVAHIGPRSTRVRSTQNVDIIVPNSSLLEKNVVNRTLSDDRYRTSVAVGVAYGSPTREVARLIRRAVDEHGKILKKPEPIVLFTEFGDNSLNFEVRFWIRLARTMDRWIIESDVRYRIDNLFRDGGIVIAFPQRDVHWDAVRPLDVRVLPEMPTEEASRADTGKTNGDTPPKV